MKNDTKQQVEVSKKTVAAPAAKELKVAAPRKARSRGRPAGTKNTPKEQRTPEHEERLRVQRENRRVRKEEALKRGVARTSDPVKLEPAVTQAVAAVAAISTPVPLPEKGRITGPVIQEGLLHFSEKDQLLYNNRELDFQSAVQAVELQKMRIVQFKQEMEKRLTAALTELKKLEGEAQEKMQSLHGIQSQLETAYGLSFEHLSYDPVSGKILIEGTAVPRNS